MLRAWKYQMLAVGLALAPALAFAHEHQTVRIGDKVYEFTIGSINEPVAVDDKSGVELTVKEIPLVNAADSHEHVMADGDPAETGIPVAGLDETLKVEIAAGNEKKTLSLVPNWSEPGGYRAVFYPTVQTTFTYRLMGTINNTNVDLSFICNPAGHPATEDWSGEEQLADGVVRLGKSGAFGCPIAKADLGFPEPSATLADLNAKQSANTGTIALSLSAVALGMSLVALRKKRM